MLILLGICKLLAHAELRTWVLITWGHGLPVAVVLSFLVAFRITAMKRRGIGAAFSDEDLEMLRSLWLERGGHAAKAAHRSSSPKRAAALRLAEPVPDRRTAAKKKATDEDGPSSSRSE
jgi:hypothetical protein